jgi:hypothetical protein
MLLACTCPGFLVGIDWILLRAGDCRGTSVLGTWAWQEVEQEAHLIRKKQLDFDDDAFYLFLHFCFQFDTFVSYQILLFPILYF